MPAVFQTFYVSRARSAFDETAVQAILERSRRHNVSVGVTGCLLFSGRCFAQVLEGERAVVDASRGAHRRRPAPRRRPLPAPREPARARVRRLADGLPARRQRRRRPRDLAPDSRALAGRGRRRDGAHASRSGDGRVAQQRGAARCRLRDGSVGPGAAGRRFRQAGTGAPRTRPAAASRRRRRRLRVATAAERDSQRQRSERQRGEDEAALRRPANQARRRG